MIVDLSLSILFVFSYSYEQLPDRVLERDIDQERCDIATHKTVCNQEEHSVVAQVEGHRHRAQQSCADYREHEVNHVAQSSQW